MEFKESLCSKCYGCNRLEDKNFNGVYRCKNYIKGAKENENSNSDNVQEQKK